MYSEVNKIRVNQTPRTPARPKHTNNDSLQVFCRSRPISSHDTCVEIVSDTKIQFTLPDNSVGYRQGAITRCIYTFQKVFPDTCNQKEIFDVVAFPLVEKLIKGTNGLLLTYGVTGSGKTYTMSGIKDDVGILPRCLDTLFNSINEYQAPKFVFKPDRLNEFEVQSEAQARKDLEESIKKLSRCCKLNKNKMQSQEDLLSVRSSEGCKISDVNPDNAYAVFVTYTEIYNDNVYDLLENFNETDVITKLQSKFIRDDANKNGYVHGVTEIEVKSAEEAFEIFYKGKKRKRMAQTALNAESSRSHSIFTIRLVQAPLDINGVEVEQNSKSICISQLSLVDLAGSERTSRTNNSNERTREAGSINNSLMTLRSCLEILRENQQTGAKKKIPCRDSKLTRLFRNFFEGKGDIRMIVCVNPHKDDYDETIQVMKFAESSQEIRLDQTPARPPPSVKTDARKRAQVYKKALQNLEEVKDKDPIAYIPSDAEIIYRLETFPVLENTDPLDPDYYKSLLKFLNDRIKKKEELQMDITSRTDKFRAAFVEREKQFLVFQRDLEAVNARRESELTKTKTLEDKVVSQDIAINTLRRKCDEYSDEVRRLKRETEFKEHKIQQFGIEKNREKRVNQKMAAKTEKLEKEKENVTKEKKQIEQQLKDQDKKLRRVKKVLESQDDNICKPKIARMDDEDTDTVSNSEENETPFGETVIRNPECIVSSSKSMPAVVINPRYNRQCEAHDKWLDHRSVVVTPLNTVMQPVLKRRKSFTGVTSPKDLKKVSKYCLLTQNQDEDGGVETQLYKGNVTPTCRGGAQVILNDVEILKQTSPVTSPITSPKKRERDAHNATEAATCHGSLYPDVAARCSVSVEGHPTKRC